MFQVIFQGGWCGIQSWYHNNGTEGEWRRKSNGWGWVHIGLPTPAQPPEGTS